MPTTQRAAGYACADGDACNGVEGTCDGEGTSIAPPATVPITCPQQTACNVCACDVGERGCVWARGDSRGGGSTEVLDPDDDQEPGFGGEPVSHRPQALIYPGCGNPKIPLSGSSWRVPVVVYGEPGFDRPPSSP